MTCVDSSKRVSHRDTIYLNPKPWGCATLVNSTKGICAPWQVSEQSEVAIDELLEFALQAIALWVDCWLQVHTSSWTLHMYCGMCLQIHLTCKSTSAWMRDFTFMHHTTPPPSFAFAINRHTHLRSRTLKEENSFSNIMAMGGAAHIKT